MASAHGAGLGAGEGRGLPEDQRVHSFFSGLTDVFSCNAAAAKSPQSCLTPRNPIDGSSGGPLVPGILQARTLEWVAITFSNAGK